ncbi:NAD(P)/FAD-dependent oxidoreductase [Chelatococcus asaccharovorans]|uniref:Glycine/D-amino acid oxidase-like deaminating enzyme n=1 Tax=Chelatococcus asaccharovorans TaxID=28210 RepID=A0A2V3U1V8_9HYPH|nr:FAD-binding oxidoreductase [Chelatococcus asaccharovorans]MBS7702332.1 FAD-binding oxidoreductase [Chelatococcus asaccharovorans]PXW56466.1 glycine/D-amino acid oxidase-like deaminating enzyme [Chelatococcus asaccharovorans]CAH1669643.1 Glycine/D-amino acid oxidase-like deaminating enzyme [Chelatococcus asaccharovorans]CAH1678899.1 Glycine/D-amino acid oxidase-like deaminating enzyme [Chelatococcus asaccharovorans]
MLNNPQSHGLWEITAPPAPVTSVATGAFEANVVVIGAGFTGLSCAFRLARGGAKVVVLEDKEIGFGGSGRNVGLVNAGLWVMPSALPAALGADYGERLLTLLGDAPRLVYAMVENNGIDCELAKTGTLHCAVGKQGLAEIQQRAEQWQARGAPVSLIGAEETARLVGSTAYAGALLDRRAGTIQPLAYVRGLAEAAIKAGAEIYTASPVTSAERAGPRWTIRTPQSSIRADWIVVATNAYTHGPWPAIRHELVHLPYFNMATEPLSEELQRTILPERQGVWDTRPILSSFRFDRAGRLVFGSVGALRGTGRAVHQAWARRALGKLFPQLKGVGFETLWYGQIGMTVDNLPRFHKLAENVISFSGYNGRGIAPGTVFGYVLAEHIAGGIAEADLPLPVTEPAAQPLRQARELFYEVGAQAAHLVDGYF